MSSTLTAGPIIAGYRVEPFAQISGPRGLTFDREGNLYTVGKNSGTVFKISPAGVVTVFAQCGASYDGYVGPVFDPVSGSFFVSAYSQGKVLRVSGGTCPVFASGLAGPADLLPGGLGNEGSLFVCEFGAGRVVKISPTTSDTGIVSPCTSGVGPADGLAFDATGNLFIANRGGNQIFRVDPNCGTKSVFCSEFQGPWGLTFRSSGSLLVTEYFRQTITEVTSTCAKRTIGSGFSREVEHLRFDPAGVNLFISDFGAGMIYKASPEAPTCGSFSGPTNGDFETPSANYGEGWVPYGAGQVFGGWTVESGEVALVHNRFFQAASGLQSVDLNSSAPGAIYQELTTIPGQTYLLRFAMAGNPRVIGDPAPVKRMEVRWGATLVDTLSFDTTGHSASNMGWADREYYVVATATTTRLSFGSLTSGTGGPTLDNVRLTCADADGCDALWNIRSFACDAGHETGARIERDGTPICGSENCPYRPNTCWSDPLTERRSTKQNEISVDIGAAGDLHVGLNRDVQVYGDTFLFISEAKALTIPVAGSAVGIWLNDAELTQQITEGELTLELEPGWNHLEFTTYHQHEGARFDIDLPLAAQVERMASSPQCSRGPKRLDCGDRVLRYEPTLGGGQPPTDPTAGDPSKALGAPDFDWDTGTGSVSIGVGGLLEIAFDQPIVNSGDEREDLFIFEVAPVAEKTVVALHPATDSADVSVSCRSSPENPAFCELGNAPGATTGIDIDAFYPGFGRGQLRFDRVLLVDDQNPLTGPTTPGADIDAVCGSTTCGFAFFPVEGVVLDATKRQQALGALGIERLDPLTEIVAFRLDDAFAALGEEPRALAIIDDSTPNGVSLCNSAGPFTGVDVDAVVGKSAQGSIVFASDVTDLKQGQEANPQNRDDCQAKCGDECEGGLVGNALAALGPPDAAVGNCCSEGCGTCIGSGYVSLGNGGILSLEFPAAIANSNILDDFDLFLFDAGGAGDKATFVVDTAAIPICGNGCVDPGEGCGELGLPDCGEETCVSCACVASGCATVSLGCPARQALGSQAEVTINVDTGSRALGAYSATVAWDPEVLRFEAALGGTTEEFRTPPTCNIDQMIGTARCNGTQAVSLGGPKGAVNVGRLRFSVVDDSRATLSISVRSLFDTTGLPIAECSSPDMKHCTIEVGGACGDVNEDGGVDVGDALLVAQFDAGMRPCGKAPFSNPEACDINPQPPVGQPDGSCDIGDALKMAQCDVGLIACNFQCRHFNCPATAGGMHMGGAALRAEETALVRLILPPGDPPPGGTLVAEVVFDAGTTPLGAYSLDLDCDSQVLEILPPVVGGNTAEFASVPLQAIEGCHVSLAAFQASRLDGPNGTVSVAMVTSRVREEARSGATSRLDLTVNSLFGTDGQPISATTEPAGITVGAPVTPTPTPRACAGDCDGLGTVTVDELVKGVKIALGSVPLEECPVFDANSDEAVTVDELVRAVNNALSGCS